MDKQRGGTVTVSTFLLMLLIAAGVASAATSLWLSSHRILQLSIFPCGRSHTTTTDHPSINI